ncbi:nucleotidyltransferase family protein [Fibrella aquatica]|jgi:uncharacterized protein|uniref:nucleotidyltransferase family protein n=1 Tax=Fibrella aquatica TaxID=3242487 RepID=UPI0035210AFA
MSQLETIRETLKQLRHELGSKYPIQSMGLFGSVVRDDFRPESDIDIIVEFNAPIGIGFIELADFLESRLGKPVDLVSKKGMKPTYYKAIEAEIIYV